MFNDRRQPPLTTTPTASIDAGREYSKVWGWGWLGECLSEEALRVHACMWCLNLGCAWPRRVDLRGRQ
jgi:hypothetical protein